MKYNRISRILAIVVILALLVVAIPATPALAQLPITLTPTSGSTGTLVTVTGSGYIPYLAYINVYIFFNQGVVAYSPIHLTYGTISATFNVPATALPGTALITVRIANSPTSTQLAIAYFTVTIVPVGTITLDPEEGTVGTEVEVSGESFADEEDITVEYNDEEVDISSGDDETDDDGEFTCTIIVPPSTAGDHIITVTGEDSASVAEAEFTVEAAITTTPESGAVGDTITLSGTGFEADEDIDITLDDGEVTTTPASVSSDSNGSFSASFNIPTSASGTHEIEASDGSNEDSVEFTVSATVSLSQATGNVGTEVTVSGTGFQASQPVTIYFDNNSIAATVCDANGSFSTIFTVPPSIAGTYKVKASDLVNTIEVDFEILTSAEISQTSGHIGTELSVSGVGFTVGATVMITYDGTLVATTPVNTDGSFLATFTVPTSSGGQHSIIATDATNTKQFDFVMESTPPVTPVPLKPEMNIKAEAQAYFDWQDVTDPSDVSYTLQIATAEDFSPAAIVLEKTGLTQSEYTITKEERLKSVSKEAPYYWHVKAIDGASNESGWSGTGSFYVGFSLSLPQWLIYTLLGISALLLGIFGFWLGRKTAYY